MYVELFFMTSFLLFDSEPVLSLKCIPKSVFVYDHNICYCDDKGQKIVCKRKMYSTLYPELRAHQLQNLTMNCFSSEPGKSVIDIGCYKCICSEDTTYAMCIPSDCNNKESIFSNRNACVPGSIFTDKCNACICGPDKIASCTNLNCYALHEINKSNDDVLCVANHDHVVECNDCSCNNFGTSMSCEKVGCNYPNFLHEHVLNVTTECTPHDIFDYTSCHKCMCGRTGNYAMCVGVDCTKQYELETAHDTIEKCNPGMIFANDCNICICDKNGKGVCTKLACNIEYTFKYVDELTYSEPRIQ